SMFKRISIVAVQSGSTEPPGPASWLLASAPAGRHHRSYLGDRIWPDEMSFSCWTTRTAGLLASPQPPAVGSCLLGRSPLTACCRHPAGLAVECAEELAASWRSLNSPSARGCCANNLFGSFGAPASRWEYSES
uniref:Secreted protein n=1 Tax=Macrostomum lignano TaxID=282301 RepID=A0A1I8FH33_9PLAT